MGEGGPPRRFATAEAATVEILERTGGEVRLALPLGLGKSAALTNALTRAAEADPSIRLSILTALTLEPPEPSGDMERRFLGPASARLFGEPEPFRYAELLRADALPENVSISEFFLMAGRWLHVDAAQRRYVPLNYTDAVPMLLERRPNVVVQRVAPGGGRFSLSCNPDLTPDLLAARRRGEADFLFAVEAEPALPYMEGAGEVGPDEIDVLLEPEGADGADRLFSLPQRPVSLADQAQGLHVSRLIRDGGTLQIGIGSLGDAVAQALLLRHGAPETHRALLAADPFGAGDDGFAEAGPFREGLHASTEMLVEPLLHLMEGGVVRREVEGAAIAAGFFIGSRDFRKRLREMPAELRRRIAMVPVSRTNALFGDEAGRRAARPHARFINKAMQGSLLGAVASDARPDGREVSGVGGQFDFVSQAFALRGARSVTVLDAVRGSGGRRRSNIVWAVPHATSPRQFRDIVATEYGVADLRWKTDEEAVRAMIAIADAEFQPELLEAAKSAGKLPRDAEIPSRARGNTPQAVRRWLAPAREAGDLPSFPFGTDFTPVERRLLPALSRLGEAAGSRRALAALVWAGLRAGAPGRMQAACLGRMGFERPSGIAARLSRAALLGALAETADEPGLPEAP
ncbi:MAG: acetyl-CoA hydrolase/transferase C-terminal domain-containing protein [Paracoccaceae bacterium]